MTLFTKENIITEKELIEFDLFNILDNDAVNNSVLVKDLEASEKIINLILRKLSWSGFSYADKDGVTKIGYGTTNSITSEGLTEQDSYFDFIGVFKNKEKQFKRIIPVDNLSQTQYDGLLSLFFFTGDIRYVGTDNRKFFIFDYIKNSDWNYLASTLILSGFDRTLRQSEAKVIMLADYGSTKDRSLIKEQGLQTIRTLHPDRFETDLAKRQAEYSYYAETKRFLPNMTQSRKRQIVKLLT